MGIDSVADIIHSIAQGFEGACADCLADNQGVVLEAVREQLYSGQNSDGRPLSPTYDDDPFFDQPGYWYKGGARYKAWKAKITPPITGTMLGLPPRAQAVPNLFVNGKFYSEIFTERRGDALHIDPGTEKGPAIVAKYGDEILNMGPTAKEYFNENYMLPSIKAFFENCGYR